MKTFAAAAILIAVSSAAFAADTATVAFEKAKADAAARQAKARAAGALDVTPPELKAFSLGGTVDTQQYNAAAIASITATDDMSGIFSVFLSLRSPSGLQSVVRDDLQNSGVKKYSGNFSVGAQSFSYPGVYFTPYSEAGVWTVEMMFIYDMNGNGKIYTASDLAAFGPTTVTVVNDGPWDNIPPILIGGVVGTKKISLSTPPTGTSGNALPVIAAAVRGFDPGNGVSSGFYSAAIEFCLPDPHSTCKDSFQITGKADAPGLADAVVRVSGSPRKDQTPGKYGIYMVNLMDLAGNIVGITSNLPAAFPKGMVVDVQP
ncbi:MAG TPA: hypothetical protein VLA16_00090 [Ideonella sp.]|nr:hypothetical protein [Ideonella sp.]